MASAPYHEPLALVIISSISIGIAACFSAFIAFDIIRRKGWKSMMAIMIPVYIINALYLWPITLWTYLKYSRPTKPEKGGEKQSEGHDQHQQGGNVDEEKTISGSGDDEQQNQHGNKDQEEVHQGHEGHEGHAEAQDQDQEMDHSHHHMHHGSDRPMFATVTIGVCHCGAGCVLGDIIGEWLVYGTNAAIGSPPRLLWTEYLVDFGFAFLFGIIFQYFSIAPMAGEWGPKVLIRALKADALSLLFFEIGLFGWMAIFQIAIFNWELPTNTVTYWWMMQIGMFFGHWTGVPINWWLIKKGIKEPCA